MCFFCVFSGLLGSHLMALQVNRTGRSMLWYNNELLELALDLGRRLLPAFNTSTGIPFPRVSLEFFLFVHYYQLPLRKLKVVQVTCMRWRWISL